MRFWLLFCIGWLVGCGGAVVPTVGPSEPAPTLAATAVPLPSPSPTAEPSPSPTPLPEPTLSPALQVQEARFSGVSFFYDADLWAGIVMPRPAPATSYTYPPPAPQTVLEYYYDVPDYLLIGLRPHDGAARVATQPLLVIQPLRTAEGVFFAGYPERLTAEWEAWEALEAIEEGQVGWLARALETGNGRGWRWVTAEQGELVYRFRGVTANGRYGLWWQYPLTPRGAGRPWPLETLSASDVTPDVRQLDLMVQTLFVNPSASTVSSLPRPEPNCTPNARFVADVNVPDGTTIAPRTLFTKTWRMQNTGSCTWSAAYGVVPQAWPEEPSLVGEMYGRAQLATLLSVTPPGGTAEVSLRLETPPVPGYYRLSWQLIPPTPPAGQPALFPPPLPFGTTLYMEVRVDQNAPVAIPRGAWASADGWQVWFGEDEIRVGEEVVCAGVVYSGRFVTGSERTQWAQFGQEDAPLPPYWELVETNCFAEGWEALVRRHVSAEGLGEVVLALPTGVVVLAPVGDR